MYTYHSKNTSYFCSASRDSSQLLYKVLKFFMILIGQFAFAIYARVVWECCGVPVSKLNKDEYLLSRYIGTSGDLIVAFNLLKIEGQEQIKWLQEWADNDKDGDDRMDIDEFHKYFQLKELRNEVISSRTRSDELKK